MRSLNKKSYKQEADFFKALGHPTRLWIVKQLLEEERCVCKFVEAAGDDFSTISRHLSVLKNAGVIDDEKRGKSVYYKLKCPCVRNFLECIEGKIKK